MLSKFEKSNLVLKNLNKNIHVLWVGFSPNKFKRGPLNYIDLVTPTTRFGGPVQIFDLIGYNESKQVSKEIFSIKRRVVSC